MPKSGKRKQAEVEHKPKSATKSAKISNGLKETAKDPYPNHPRPTAEECLSVRDDLLAFHGFPKEFAEYRKQRLISRDADGTRISGPSDLKESVLDGLVRTLLSQNTTEVNSQKAFACLKSAFPTWEDVLAAESTCIEDAIRCGGLARTKASCIKNLLRCLLEKKEKLCLEYLRDLSVDEIKAELSHYKGIGPKTVACVLMFQLQQDDFPVDTHVFEIAKAMGWVPVEADRNKTYLHLNQRIPNELKFDLNCLLFTHGKLCRKCIKKGGNQQGKESDDNSCPLLRYRMQGQKV
ncbi:putative DNA glycosylase [Prunus yedoensis var. nudiflora]|uniref:Putative DNA glycosylase n=1 Tax=Prunus yedoensis var. nudiflora TaxID=2094558 RepID=A0A314YIM2_PRUYE|nr:putative DNA glycosylase [Prunus yedoensis var. nudiflora]